MTQPPAAPAAAPPAPRFRVWVGLDPIRVPAGPFGEVRVANHGFLIIDDAEHGIIRIDGLHATDAPINMANQFAPRPVTNLTTGRDGVHQLELEISGITSRFGLELIQQDPTRRLIEVGQFDAATFAPRLRELIAVGAFYSLAPMRYAALNSPLPTSLQPGLPEHETRQLSAIALPNSNSMLQAVATLLGVEVPASHRSVGFGASPVLNEYFVRLQNSEAMQLMREMQQAIAARAGLSASQTDNLRDPAAAYDIMRRALRNPEFLAQIATAVNATTGETTLPAQLSPEQVALAFLSRGTLAHPALHVLGPTLPASQALPSPSAATPPAPLAP